MAYDHQTKCWKLGKVTVEILTTIILVLSNYRME